MSAPQPVDTGHPTVPPPDVIDLYVARLFDLTAAREIDATRLRYETLEHLRDLQQSFLDDGADPASAARLAVQRFGSPRSIAGVLPRRGAWPALQLLRASAPAFAVCLLVIGVAGLAALAVVQVTGLGAGHAAIYVQIAAGFAGVSMIESRRRRRVVRDPAETPGVAAGYGRVVAVTTLTVGAAAAGLAVGVLAVVGEHHAATGPAAAMVLCATAALCAPRVRLLRGDG